MAAQETQPQLYRGMLGRKVGIPHCGPSLRIMPPVANASADGTCCSGATSMPVSCPQMHGQQIHRGLFARRVGSLHMASISLDDAFVANAHDDVIGDSE